jgi:transcriptional regulator with GAF, ATPase, and Fis domain/tetratricopeptide (TPR) repeat protein
MTLLPGDILAGRYQVESPLSEGGMGSVFLVRERPTGARRVLKQLRAEHPELLEAFRAEFSLLASVTDPNLMRVHDFGSSRVRGTTLSYYVAEWIDGQRLSDFARTASSTRLLAAVRDALSGLSALHDLGVLHGDFTPSNVLVDRKGRATLIDLGCARSISSRTGVVSGTPGYLAPEVLSTGTGDARSDLFAVGVTLQNAFALSGAAPPPPIAAILAQLTASDPLLRPASAHEALKLLGGAAQTPSARRGMSRRLVGRDAEFAAFLEFVRAVLEKRARPRFLCLHGAAGAGTTRLLRELTARAELEIDVLRAHSAEPKAVRWLLTEATGWNGTAFNARTAIAAAGHLANAHEPRLLVLEDADRLEQSESEILLAFARSLPEAGAVALLVSSREPLSRVQDECLAVGPLDLGALRSWTENTISEGKLSEILRATGGVAGAVERELARLLGGRAPEGPRLEGDEELGAALATLSSDETAALALLVALEGEIAPEVYELDASSYTKSLTLGLVLRDRARIRLRERDKLGLFRQALNPKSLEEAHARVVRALSEAPREQSDAAREAEILMHTVLSGRLREAERRLISAEPAFTAEPRALIQRALPLLAATRNPRTLMTIAAIALLANEPRPALIAALRVLRLRPRSDRSAEARLLAADALIRLGRARRAERLIGSLLHDHELRVLALERVARARMQRGDHAGAKAAAEEGLALDPESRRPLLLETLAVAEGYLGHAALADAHFARVVAWLDAERQPRDVCRLLGHRAIAAFRAGRVADAARDHERALEVADRSGLDDLVAVCSLNLGTAEQQLGNLGGALASYERGLSVARAVGRESTEITLRYNLANLRAEIGDLPGAARELERLAARAQPTARDQLAPSIALLCTELLLANGDVAGASRELDGALPVFVARGLLRESVEAELCRAELELALGATDEAERRAALAEERARELGASDILVRASIARARAEIARHDPRGPERLERALALASEAGQRLLEARILTELHRALGAPEWGDRARRAWDRMAANLPEELRAIFWKDARRAGLEGFTQQLRVQTAGNEAETLRRLLSLSRRMNSSLSLTTVLEYALEAATELTGAERGFLLLLDGAEANTEPRIAASRPSAVGGDPPSRSIVRKVLESEEAVLATDAQSDERFHAHGSIHALRLKSVLCVPIGTPASALGVLYVDSRVQRGRFGSADRALLLALADQLAVALSNARLHAELEQRARELADQKAVIERLSRGKDRELERLREEVEVQKRALALRYDYSRIVGRGPKMRALLEKLDRVIDANASVMIQGESGTGKELVARALHVNGARAEGPFVGVNCAALPEPLLESELFGHVRGAFTGADRDKKGLLLTAHGGTLFLDEVGEMPLVTQAKLLRVLQEREVRPLGAARAVPLDVRLVSATHRDLLALVTEGRFREDLYYRLAVVVLELPPLRDRIEDLPALCSDILNRLARDAGRPLPELSTEALRALAVHPFPGNVRELENVLTRAFVLNTSGRIGAADLDIVGQRPRPRRSSNREAYETEERDRILAALAGCRWNVSVVARQLGIPRNTLYRKLRKYGLERDPAA